MLNKYCKRELNVYTYEQERKEAENRHFLKACLVWGVMIGGSIALWGLIVLKIMGRL